MSAQLTLGVIGHVDHGKTSLVKALTGIDTDRLKEEQARGMSIVLGFSYLETARGTIDLIDVPGHERFIRTMIAGATGISGVLLVVAANEGIRPQTREHFDIARLLGVAGGLVVLTKTDLMDAAGCERVEQEIREFVAGSFLDGAPLIHTSARDGRGMDALRFALEAMLPEAAAPPIEERSFYLPIDRSFAMPGFGTVVTGTLRGGVLSARAEARLMPQDTPVRIRELQVHNRAVEAALPGQRVAASLRQINKNEVRRGDALAPPGFLSTSLRLDAEVRFLADARPLPRNGGQVRLLFGTTETIASIKRLDAREFEAGATALVRLQCQDTVATHVGLPFIVRSTSPLATLGGGRFLDVASPVERRAAAADRLGRLARGDLRAIVLDRIECAGARGVSLAALARELGRTVAAIRSELDGAPVVLHDDLALCARQHQALVEAVLRVLEEYHATEPTRGGLPPRDLLSRLAEDVSDAVFDHLIGRLQADGRLEADQGLLRLPGFDPLDALGDDERRMVAEMERMAREGSVTPPDLAALLGGDRRRRDLYHLLTRTGALVPVHNHTLDRPFVFHRGTVAEIRARLEAAFPYPTRFTVSDVRQLLDSTRKYVVPLLEYFDANGVTLRTGDHRTLRRDRTGERRRRIDNEQAESQTRARQHGGE